MLFPRHFHFSHKEFALVSWCIRSPEMKIFFFLPVLEPPEFYSTVTEYNFYLLELFLSITHLQLVKGRGSKGAATVKDIL